MANNSMGKETQDSKDMPEATQVEVKVIIAPNGLRATARIAPPKKSAGITSEGDDSKTPPEETELPVTIHYLEKAIRDFGINTGIDQEAIGALATGPRGEAQVVAYGVPPVAGEDGYIEIKFEKQISYELPSETTKKIDWRELTRIPSVKSGEELARLHPPKPGTPGVSVTGEEIPARVPKEAKLKIGKGCEIVEGDRVVATTNGLPSVKGGRISVSAVLVRNKGVNMKTGNVLFDGTVVVKQVVEENMAVKAGMDIEVHGNVRHAELDAVGRIVIRNNLVGGSARAGGIALLHLRCLEQWELLTKGIQGSISALKGISKDPAFTQIVARRGLAPILQQLFNTKFKFIRNTINTLDSNYQGIVVEQLGDVNALLDPMKRLLTSGVGKDYTMDEFSTLGAMSQRMVDYIKTLGRDESSITAKYIQSARVEAFGDIIVNGRGCYQADLWAGRAVYVKGQSSVVRGGTTKAQTLIEVATAGSPAGVPTFFQVGPKGYIKIKTVNPNVQVQVGKERYKFDASEGFISAHINKEGRLVTR